MSHTPNYDAKVKAILDAVQMGPRECALTGQSWEMTERELSWCRKFNVPPSARAPITRMWCLSGFFLASQWWWNQHAETGKPILAFIHPATGIKVLPDKEWFDRDFTSVGRDVDVYAPFFIQLRELQLQVPLLADRNVEEPENSIAKFSMGDINSYFVMFTRSRDTIYSHWAFDVEDCAEIWNSFNVTKSYHIANSHRIYASRFLNQCFDCLSSAFLFDCRNCEFCFGATNKRNKKYVWMNEQLTKDEWEKRYAEVNWKSRASVDKMVEAYHALVATAVWPENFNEQAENSTGEYLTKVNNVVKGFSCIDGVHDVENIGYSSGDSFDSAHCAGLFTANNCYMCTNPTKSTRLLFSYNCQSSQNLEYCLQCFNCENCFGCVGLNRKKFCVFNKQYSEQEYWDLVDKLKCAMLDRGEYGEFMPLSMSPGYFPDSGAPKYFAAPESIGREKLGALDFDPESHGAIGTELSDTSKLRQVSEVPDNLDDFKEEDWIGVPIYDPVLKRRFSYIRPEIALNRRHGIALSNAHFIRRHAEIFAESNMGYFEEVSCGSCGNKVDVAKNIKYPNKKVYCREDYLKFIESNG